MGFALNFITDGTTEINLIDPKALFVDGWVQKIAQQKSGGFYSDSALADGADLVLESASNVVEELPLYIRGKDPDQIAASGQLLFDLGYKLRQYSINPGRQTSPVYWGYRPKDQTNIQYALLKNYRVEPATETHGHSFKGMIHKPATFVGTLFLEREPYWRDGPPGVLPTPLSLTHPDAPSMATQLWVANYRNSFSLTHIYNFDDSAATFSANLIASSSFNYFPATPAVNDIVYFGSTQGPFFNIVPFIGTPGVTNVTYIWEYWNGSAWTDASALVDTGDLGTSGTRTRTGTLPIRFNGNSTWSKTTINTISAYWLRLRISAFTSWTTSPANSTQAVYTSNDEYIEIDASDLVGDVESLLRVIVGGAAGSTPTLDNTYCNSVIIGAKSRGLTNFTSRLNAGSSNKNPSGWSITFGSDTIDSQDGSSPTGDRAGILFTIILDTQSRITWTLSNNANSSDWEGLYQVFLVCKQIGGSPGTVYVRLAQVFNIGYEISGPSVPVLRFGLGTYQDKEIVNLGRFRIPATGSNVTNDTAQYVRFELHATAPDSTPDLFVYELVLIPVDEWSVELRDPLTGPSGGSTNYYLSALRNSSRLDFDAGILREELNFRDYTTAPAVSGNLLAQSYGYVASWELRGQPPIIYPGRTTRLYFMFSSWPKTGTPGNSNLIKNSGVGGMISVYARNRWGYLRGTE